MFLEFYGLKEQPFGVTPNPRFLYLGAGHREALASLIYGIEAGRGFLALIAEPGMGKTTLLFQMLQHFRPSARTAFLFQTQCTPREFLRFLLLELGCELNREQDLVAMHEALNRCLLEEARAGRHFIVVVDEAQNLDPAVLEMVRLLSNFETPQAKLLQIVLAGQPELAEKISRPCLGQLRQRLSVLTRLPPLPAEEVDRYVSFRLRAAGHAEDPIFTPQALSMIADLSGGIPRKINNICFNAMSLGYATEQYKIGQEVIGEVATDLDLSPLSPPADIHRLEREAMLPSTGRAEAPLLEAADLPLSRNKGGLDELSTPQALAYISEVVRLLRGGQRFA
ncbi:MAG: AAA family ATPase [Acidobacteria bacterium]|nr:AAA family ATPase [Acidobacteriota bacterium]